MTVGHHLSLEEVSKVPCQASQRMTRSWASLCRRNVAPSNKQRHAEDEGLCEDGDVGRDSPESEPEKSTFVDIESPPLLESLWNLKDDSLMLAQFLVATAAGSQAPKLMNANTITTPTNLQIYPRGLQNHGNTCFMNSILQSLFYCDFFTSLLMIISKSYSIEIGRNCPIIESFLNLYDYFKKEVTLGGVARRVGKSRAAKTRGKASFVNGVASSTRASVASAAFPRAVLQEENLTESFLRKLGSFHPVNGAQEDAQEFLCYLIEAMNEEMILNRPSIDSEKTEDQAALDYNSMDDEWTQAGPRRGKGGKITCRITRTTESPISRIFSGTFKSTLTTCSKSYKKTGRNNATSSITYQPFRSVPLDIDLPEITNIEEALLHLTVEETLQMDSPTSTTLKQSLFHELPLILVLHLKRFIYNSDDRSIKKLEKHIDYPLTLEFPQAACEGMAPSKGKAARAAAMTYRLVAVIDHHGKDVDDGHYTCFTLNKKTDTWYFIDDDHVDIVKDDNVVVAKRKFQVPYLLFYERNT